MLRVRHSCGLLVHAFALLFAISARASAQWYITGDVGGNYTQVASISIAQPSTDTNVEFHHVAFAARPFATPPYYAWSAGRLLGRGRRLGIEFQFTHLKVIAKTGGAYQTTGEIDGVGVDASMPMDDFVQQYAMTHGLNFMLVNLLTRTPIGRGRFTITTRVGGGGTLPHAETIVDNVPRDQYQFAGPGGAAAIGVAMHVKGALSLTSAYKLTVARPRISLADGTGRMWAVTHQIVGGFALGF